MNLPISYCINQTKRPRGVEFYKGWGGGVLSIALTVVYQPQPNTSNKQ